MGDIPCQNAPVSGELPSELAGSLCWLLSFSAHNLGTGVGCDLKKLELSFRSFSVLLVLSEDNGSSQLKLAKRVGLDKTTMMATLDELEGMELLVRAQSATDRRVNTVSLTRKGKKRLRDAQAMTQSKEAEALADLSAVEIQELTALLKKLSLSLCNNLSTGSCI